MDGIVASLGCLTIFEKRSPEISHDQRGDQEAEYYYSNSNKRNHSLQQGNNEEEVDAGGEVWAGGPLGGKRDAVEEPPKRT